MTNPPPPHPSPTTDKQFLDFLRSEIPTLNMRLEGSSIEIQHLRKRIESLVPKLTAERDALNAALDEAVKRIVAEEQRVASELRATGSPLEEIHRKIVEAEQRHTATLRKEHERLNGLLEEVRKIDVVNIAVYAQARLKQIRETFDRDVATYMAAEHSALVADGERQQRSIGELLDRAATLSREAERTTERLAALHTELPQLATAAENLRTELADDERAARATLVDLQREREGLEAIHRKIVEELVAHGEAAEDRVDERIRNWLLFIQSRARAAFATFAILCCVTVGLSWAISRSNAGAVAKRIVRSSPVIIPIPDSPQQPPASIRLADAASLTYPDANGQRSAYVLARGEAHVGLALRSEKSLHLYVLEGESYVYRGSVPQQIQSADDIVRAYPEYAKLLR